MTEQQKRQWTERTKRLFVQRLLVLYLGEAMGLDWVGATMQQLLDAQVDYLAESGLSQPAIQAVFDTLKSWADRGYGLNFIAAGPADPPDFHLTFIDEMDADPDIIQMRAALAKLHAES